MQYQVTIGDRVLQVRLRRHGDRLFVSVDEAEELPVRLSTVRGALRSLEISDRRVELLASVASESVSLAMAGVQYEAEVLDEAHARLAQMASARGVSHARRELKAPMPGLVVRVLAGIGDSIDPGQPLVVLQAMKMENELSVPREGTVSSISVSAGQTVEAGQVLAVIE